MAQILKPRPEPGKTPVRSMKRLLLGKPLATARLEHERLGKPTALAVFSSDNLSSVAYATEEILRVLVPVVGLAAFSFVVPISMVIVGIEAILIFSYRQTIKAYPTAGGAYIVTKDNFGLLPAQVAGVALLSDYVLTVAVSVAAGTQALSSVAPGVHSYRVIVSLAFVWAIAYANLLGVRESGRLFAAPTFGFIICLYVTIGIGLFRVVTGSLEALPFHHQPGALPIGTGAAGLFIILRAFASGGAAVTGVEAISNGVPAFRKPEWRNARTTLVWMGCILGASFLAVSYLAAHLHVLPTADESKSVLAQIGELVYGSGPLGNILFLFLQATTMLILVLAANTSFADFPRLANFHAGDAFLPRQFTKRGHRLVFSNGIIALAVAASVVLVAFNASVTNLIPLYALGVFTSFTLSQAGMAKRHLRLREPGWGMGFFINGLGAVATAVVDVIIAVVKFSEGGWMMLVAVPILVTLLVRVNKTYEAEDVELMQGLVGLEKERTTSDPHIAVVLVETIDQKTINAVEYASAIDPDSVMALHISMSHPKAQGLKRSWALAGPPVPLHTRHCDSGDMAVCLKEFLSQRFPSESHVTVMVPVPERMNLLERVGQRRRWAQMTAPLRELDNVSLLAVKDTGKPVRLRGGRVALEHPARHRVLILVGRLNRSVVKAIKYARRLDASEVSALHAAVDPDQAERLMEEWITMGQVLDIPIDVHECEDRDIGRVVKQFVRDLRADGSRVTVVLPRLFYPSPLQGLLHDRTSQRISGVLRDEEFVQVVVVPYQLGRDRVADSSQADSQASV